MRKTSTLLAALAVACVLWWSPTAAQAAQPRPASGYLLQGCLRDIQTASYHRDFFDGDHVALDSWDTGDAHFHLTAFTFYYFCFSRDQSVIKNRLLVDAVKFCVTKDDNRDPWSGHYVQGWRFNPLYWTLDGNHMVDTAGFGLDWSGNGSDGDTVCTKRYGLPSDTGTDWMILDNRPVWSVSGHVQVANMSDVDILFHDVDTSSQAHRFSPSSDVESTP